MDLQQMEVVVEEVLTLLLVLGMEQVVMVMDLVVVEEEVLVLLLPIEMVALVS
jgi:hypothetical protein